MSEPSARSQAVAVGGVYGAFTLTDGALRTLVLLHLHARGFTPLELAALFVGYEALGVAINLGGGWVASRVGLRRTLASGLALQALALASLAASADALALPLVVAAQGASGIAKDLVKTASKSWTKRLVPEGDDRGLLKLVSAITGSKNALKGVGLLLGGVLLQAVGFAEACWGLAAVVVAALVATGAALPRAAAGAAKARVTELLSRDERVNWLALARLFLFGARDAWFVVALPVFLAADLGWSAAAVSAFLALWTIGYGGVQGAAPAWVGARADAPRLLRWNVALLVPLAATWGALHAGAPAAWTLVVGLAAFGAVFAANSALHSTLIVAYAESEKVTLRVGFYYAANAAGRLVGTALSGAVFQAAGLGRAGLEACLLAAAALVVASALAGLPLVAAERRAAPARR